MIHIFLDFEMNYIDKSLVKKFKDCHMEIIEIGAVALNEKNEEISSFKRYIKPEYNKHIMPRYVELTGITDKMVANSPHFKVAFSEFLDWCNSLGKENNYEIFAWSQSDKEQLQREIKQKKLSYNDKKIKWMLSHWRDYQKEYCKLIGLNQALSLDKAISSVDQAFLGKQHDALCDARNTARLYALAQDKKKFKEIMKPVFDTVNNDTSTFTYELGDIFNFENFETNTSS